MTKSARLILLVTILISPSLIAKADLVRQKKSNAKAAQGALKQTDAKNISSSDSMVPDKFYRFKRIFLFPGIDDLSGVIAPNLDQKLTELFSQNPRFELVVDAAVVHALSPDDANYAKVAQSDAVHREAANASQADATVLVRVHTRANRTEIILDWRDRDGQLVLSETSSLPSFSSLDAQKEVLEGIFATTVKRIPFLGSVTGRKDKIITIDLGDGYISQGDQVEVARIISAQRHPLLKTIVRADYVKLGKARVTTVDRVLSFAEVTEETNNEFMGPDSKIIAIRPAEKKILPPPKPVPMYDKREEHRMEMDPLKPVDEQQDADDQAGTKVLHGDFDRPKGRYGSVAAGLGYGNLTHSNTTNSTTSSLSGSGLGASLEGQLWITRDWILGGDYAFQSATLNPSATTTDVGPISGASWNRMNLLGAYRFLPGGSLDSTVVLFGAGYQMKHSNVPANTSYQTSNIKYTGIMFRVDGDISINGTNRAFAGISLVPFGSADGYQSATSLGFKFGWSLLVQGTLWARLGFDYDSTSATTSDATVTRSDKHYALEPALFYYF